VEWKIGLPSDGYAGNRCVFCGKITGHNWDAPRGANENHIRINANFYTVLKICKDCIKNMYEAMWLREK